MFQISGLDEKTAKLNRARTIGKVPTGHFLQTLV